MTTYVPLHRSPQLPTGVNHFVRRCATRKDKLQGTGFWRYLGFLESVSPYSGVWLTLRLDTPGGCRMMRPPQTAMHPAPPCSGVARAVMSVLAHPA
jgi:hypothetical protein